MKKKKQVRNRNSTFTHVLSFSINEHEATLDFSSHASISAESYRCVLPCKGCQINLISVHHLTQEEV